MDLKIGDATLTFTSDDDEQPVAVVELQAWRGFVGDSSREELRGARVQLAPADPAGSADLAAPTRHERAIARLFAHQEASKLAVLDAIAGYIDVPRNDHGIDEDELAAFRSVDRLLDMVDLSFVHVRPQCQDGLPFLGFEFECNRDPEHGCGALLHGALALDVGGAGTAQTVELIGGHGGRL